MVSATDSRLSRATTHLLFLAAALFALAALVVGKTPLMDMSGALVTALYALLLGLALRFSPTDLKPHALAIAWFALIFFLPRLFTFAVFPPETIMCIGTEHLSPAEVTRGMLFVTVGTMALFAGLWLGNLPFARTRATTPDTPSPPALPLGPILLFWVAALAAAYYVTVVLQVSIFGPPENWGSRSGWLMRIFDTDVALLLLVVWCAVHILRGRPNYALVVGLLSVWLIASIYLGSRGGPLRIFFLFGLAALAIHGDPRMTRRKLFAILALTFAASALVYPLSTIVRYTIGGVEAPTEQLMSDWTRNTCPPVHEPSSVTPVQALLWHNDTVVRAAQIMTPITTRLGVIDYPLIIVNRTPDPAVIEKYLTLDYALRNYANNMVPGELFPDHDVMTSRVFTMAYRAAPESHIRTAFLSEPWTSWGFAWIKGGAFGGLAILAALAAVAQYGYRAIGHYLPASIAPYALTTWLFVVTGNGPLQLFGLDHWLTVASHVFMALGTALALVWITSLALSRLGVTSPFWVLPRHRPGKMPPQRPRNSAASSSSITSQDGTT